MLMAQGGSGRITNLPVSRTISTEILKSFDIASSSSCQAVSDYSDASSATLAYTPYSGQSRTVRRGYRAARVT